MKETFDSEDRLAHIKDNNMKAEQMHRMCLRKHKYRTEELALKYAKECDEKYGKKHRVYYCPLCGFFHLTTKRMKGQNDGKG